MNIRDKAAAALAEVRASNRDVIQFNSIGLISSLNQMFDTNRFMLDHVNHFMVWADGINFVLLCGSESSSENAFSNYRQVTDLDSKIKRMDLHIGVLSRIVGSNSMPVVYKINNAAELGELIERQYLILTDEPRQLPSRIDVRDYVPEVKRL